MSMSSSSQTIKQFRESPNAELAHNAALEVLNGRFVYYSHLDDLQQSLVDAYNSKIQLHQQSIESSKEIDTLTTNARIEAVLQLDKTKELASLRDGLEDDLAYLSHDLVSVLSPTGDENTSTLLEDIEAMHRSLKELESVRSYAAVIQCALLLSESASSQIRNSSSPIQGTTTSKYQALLAFINGVKRSCGPVEGIDSSNAPLNLILFLERIRDKTWGDMKTILFSTLISASETLKWPTAVEYDTMSKENREAFESAVSDLLRLQEIGDSLQPPRENEGLYPLQALVQPVALRFKYHFDSERETNRLDKPEWYFTHIANIAYSHRPFMEDVVQKLISGSKFQDVNAWHNYTTLLLPILERKLRRSVPGLLARPALLAHTVYQSLIFDSTLREMGYEFIQSERSSHEDEMGEIVRGGVSKVILDQRDWFDVWLQGEKKFANDQYHEIISASDAWVISHDDTRENAQNHAGRGATTSARRTKALVEQVTDRYLPLPSFRQRTQFLVHVQLPILELYHARICSSLDAFETLSSALVRAVPGALGVDGPKTDTRKLTGGVEGSQRLCKALLSARYIEDAMRAWGEEAFFLELWTEINRRASLRKVAGPHTSLPEHNTRTGKGETDSEGTIFEELITQFSNLSSRAEDMLVQQICGECEASLKSHFSSLAIHTQDPDDSTVDVVVPSTLLPAVALLSSHLTFLRSTLPASAATRLYRRTASRISEHVLQRQVLFRPSMTRGSARHGLTRAQARSVQAECELWAESSQIAMNTSRARAEQPWSRLLVAGRLLGADLGEHTKLLDTLFDVKADGWEEILDSMTELGSGGLALNEVKVVLRLRDDCWR